MQRQERHDELIEPAARRERLALIALLAAAAIFTPAGLLLWLGPTEPVHEWLHKQMPKFHNCHVCYDCPTWAEGHPNGVLLGKAVTFVAVLCFVAMGVLLLNRRARSIAKSCLISVPSVVKP